MRGEVRKQYKKVEKYESKQAQIVRPASMVYATLSDFSNFTPILQDKVENWHATTDTCSFKAKGFEINLRIVEREINRMVKIEAEDGTPFNFSLWLQLVEVDAADTRIRLVLHVDLNMMMKMMVGGKIRAALDQVVDQMAESFNNVP